MKIDSQEKVWDKIAKNWNEFRETPSPSVINFLEDKKGKILDLGCGSGRNFKALGKEVELFGVDFSGEMLKLAEENAKKLNLSSSFEKTTSSKLPFKDNFFDSAICVAVLHCISSQTERKDTIAEIFRTLKKGKFAFISVWGKHSPTLKNKDKECFVSWNIKDKNVKEKRYTYVYDLEELEKEVLEAGFKIEKIWEERNVNVIVKK